MTPPLTLVLVRHGRAEGNDPRLPDFDRQLDVRGRAEAASLGRRLRARGLASPAVFASPALRTLQTAQLMLTAMGEPVEAVQALPRLYLAGADALADAVRKAPADARTAIVVAHNPGIGDFARWLAPDGTAEGFGTGEARIAALSSADWHTVDAGAALELVREPGSAQ